MNLRVAVITIPTSKISSRPIPIPIRQSTKNAQRRLRQRRIPFELNRELWIIQGSRRMNRPAQRSQTNRKGQGCPHTAQHAWGQKCSQSHGQQKQRRSQIQFETPKYTHEPQYSPFSSHRSRLDSPHRHRNDQDKRQRSRPPRFETSPYLTSA